MKKSLTATFWALVVNFLLIVSEFLIPAVRELFRGSLLFLLPFVIFSLLGVVLIFLAIKEGAADRKRKKFLMLTGASAAGFFLSVLLHNAFYGLAVITDHITILRYLMEVLHVAFFLIAIFVCPIGFLIGAVGTIVLLNVNRDSHPFSSDLKK